jgi:hypothetical protein
LDVFALNSCPVIAGVRAAAGAAHIAAMKIAAISDNTVPRATVATGRMCSAQIAVRLPDCKFLIFYPPEAATPDVEFVRGQSDLF